MNYRQDHPAWIYVRCANSNPQMAFDRLYDLSMKLPGMAFSCAAPLSTIAAATH